MGKQLYEGTHAYLLGLLAFYFAGEFFAFTTSNILLTGLLLLGVILCLLLQSLGNNCYFWIYMVVVSVAFGTSLLSAGLRGKPFLESQLKPAYEVKPELLPQLLCVLFLACVMVAANRILGKNLLLPMLVSVVLLSVSMVWMIQGYLMSGWVFAAIACYVCLTLLEVVEKRWKKKRGNMQCYIAFLVPFFLLYFALLCYLPAPKEPFEWRAVKKIGAQLADAFSDTVQGWFGMGENELFLPTAGFSENAFLGNGFRRTNRRAFCFTSNPRNTGSIYVKALTYDLFTGRKWEESDAAKYAFAAQGDPDRPTAVYDLLETAAAVRAVDGEYVTDYLHRYNLTIRFEELTSDRVFMLPKGYVYTIKKAPFSYINAAGDLAFEKKQKSGFEYRTVMTSMNLGTPLFDALLSREDLRMDTDTLMAAAEDYGIAVLCPTAQEWEQYHTQLHEIYDYKYELSEEAKAWLLEVTRDTKSRYEALKAVEQALSEFTYTSRRGVLAMSVDSPAAYVDYLLFEGKEGYCSYFATAFVLFARQLGYPARYVQGYCVPGDHTTVYQNMAHAWPEVYFEGVGWIPFEPTPGYGGGRYSTWNLKERTESMTAGQEQNIPQAEENGPNSEKSASDKEQAQEEERQEEQKELSGITIVEIVILSMLLLAGLFFLAAYLRVQINRKKRTVQEEFLDGVYENLAILEAVKLKRRDEETLKEFKERLLQTLTLPQEAGAFLSCLEQYSYGNAPITEDMLQTVAAARELLFAELIRQNGKQNANFVILLYRMSGRHNPFELR